MVDFGLSRGRDAFVRPGGDGFERYRAGQATIILDNSDERFNPFNIASPLYPHVTPGKSVRIAVKNGSAGTDWSLMRGKIADIQPYNQGSRRMVKIDVIDGQQFLRDRTVKIGLRSGDYPFTTGGAINTTGFWVDFILERANWPDEWPRTYDLLTDYSGQLVEGFTEDFYTQLAHAWFWNRDAMESVRELENTELGTFLHDRNGNARFFSQRKTYDNLINIDESEILRDISTPQPWETLRNRIEVTVGPIEIHEIDGIIGIGTGTELLWKVGGAGSGAVPIGAEGSVTFDAVFRWQNFDNIVPMNTFIDFDVNSSREGTGTDLTAQCRVLSGEIGNGATISLLNDSATDGFIIDLSLYGDAIYQEFESLVTAEDETSIGTYGTRVLKLQSPWMQAVDYAQAIADFLLENFKDPIPYPIIKIETRPALQFPLDLYTDVVHLTAGTLSLNKVYRIGKIDHDWLNNNGQAVVTTLKLEPYFAVDAPVLLDCNLYSPFSDLDETDATPVSPPLMDWTLAGDWVHDDLNSGAQEVGYLRCPISSAGDATDSATATISYTVVVNDVLSFWYRYADTAGHDPDDIAIRFIAETDDPEFVYSGSVPFVASANSGWLQFVGDFPEWMIGLEVTSLQFYRDDSFTDAGANFYLDSVCIGTRLT